MKSNLKRIVFGTSMFFLSFTFVENASAQYVGPGANGKTLSVKELTDQAFRLDKSDAQVSIQGFVVKQINKDTYLFKDNTGSLNVEISKKHLPNRAFNDKTELKLIGEVDYDFLNGVELEVNEVIFVK